MPITGAPVDHQLLGRPCYPHLELAVPVVRVRPHGPQPLCHVRSVPPQGGSCRLGLVGSDCPRLGYLRWAGVYIVYW